MRRREFLGVLSGATAWPLAARAHLDRVRRFETRGLPPSHKGSIVCTGNLVRARRIGGLLQ
jgi:hypothetical protein